MQVLKRRWLFGLSVLFALFYISFGTVLQGVGEFDDNGERVFWGVAGVAIGIFILAGLRLSRPRPKLGGTLIVIGGITGGFITFWLIVTPVVGLAVAVYGVLRAREMAREQRYEHVLGRGRGSRA